MYVGAYFYIKKIKKKTIKTIDRQVKIVIDVFVTKSNLKYLNSSLNTSHIILIRLYNIIVT